MGVSLRPDRQADILSAIESELDFGPLVPSTEYLEEMTGLIHPADVLRRAGYTLQKLSPGDIDQKRRCFRCNRKWLKKPRHGDGPKQTPKQTPVRVSNSESSDAPSSQDQQNQRIRCRYHEGGVLQGRWTCCNGSMFAPPCVGNEEHTPRTYAQGELERQWTFYHTPPFKPKLGSSPADAVVIDCEMGTNMYGESELIRVSVIDYFSRAILLDSLVWPDVKMIHYNTKFSGVTRRAINDAKKHRTCLFGRASVRKRIWEFVGPQTMVIGHAAQGDLASLRWIHARVVDTLIIETRNRPPPPPPRKDETAQKDEDKEKGEEDQESEEADKDVKDVAATSVAGVGQNELKKTGGGERRKEGGLSLKALAQSHLRRTIQIKGQGHDSVEDALATRDILHWNVMDIMKKKKKALIEDDDDDDDDEDDDDDDDEEDTFQVA